MISSFRGVQFYRYNRLDRKTAIQLPAKLKDNHPVTSQASLRGQTDHQTPDLCAIELSN